jgi:hypothetical protein
MRWVALLVLMDRFVRTIPAAEAFRYGVEAKILHLQEVLGVEGHETEFSKLLRKHGYDEHLAVNAYLAIDGFPQPEAPWAQNPRAGASLEPDRDHPSNPGKRLRAAQFTRMYADEPAEPDVVRPVNEPNMAPAEPHVAGPGLSPHVAGLGPSSNNFGMMQSLDRINARIDALHLDLPRALREYDAGVLASQKDAAREAALGNETYVIEHATTMADLEALDGFRFNASENVIICENCTRFSSNSPGMLLT